MSSLNLHREFNSFVRGDPRVSHAFARTAEGALHKILNDYRRPHLALHVVSIKRGFSNDYVPMHYLGRIGKRDYYLDSHQGRGDNTGHIFSGRARSRSRGPVCVRRVAAEELTLQFTKMILTSISREWRRKDRRLFRIPRGYYPYAYFINWYSSKRGGRRKFHTLHRDGVIQARTFKEACEKLKQGFSHRNGEDDSADSITILMSSGYHRLVTCVDGEQVYRFTPEFCKRGTLCEIEKKKNS